MHVRNIFSSLFLAFCVAGVQCSAQQTDTLQVEYRVVKDAVETDTIPVVSGSDTAGGKKVNVRRATLRSAIIPGWGQAYNKKYWKIPIVYGALGVSAGIFAFNLKTYKELRLAVIYRRDAIPGNDTLIKPELRPLSTESLIYYRNAYRQNIDYSVLAFLALWGLNVVDATVDAHLRTFDVSPDLTMKIKPQYRFETSTAGISLVFQLKRRENTFNLPH